jgi:hypothetical protein
VWSSTAPGVEFELRCSAWAELKNVAWLRSADRWTSLAGRTNLSDSFSKPRDWAEVYRAHDTKLGRDVALKVIPETFALDADRVARFKREAQVLASLNHPHIGAITASRTVARPTRSSLPASHSNPESGEEVLESQLEIRWAILLRSSDAAL